MSIDPNTLAAFIDGKLSAEERAAVIAQLNHSDDELDALLAAAGIANELGEVEPAFVQPAPVQLPAPPTASRPRHLFRWAAVAALLPAAAAVMLVFGRSDAVHPLDLVGSFQPPSRVTSEPGWEVTRGGAATVPETALQFRAGSRAAALHVAVRAGDRAAAARLAAELAVLLRDIPFAGSLAQRYQALALDPSAYAEHERELRTVLGDRAFFQLGVWSELGRAALTSGDRSFFNDDSRASLEAIQDELDAESNAGQLVSQILDEWATPSLDRINALTAAAAN